MKQKKNPNKLNIANWLTSRFLLIVRDEENFEEKVTLKFTYMRLLVATVVLLLIFLGIGFAGVTTFLSEWFDPRTEYMRTSRTLVELEERVDSLLIEMEQKEQFMDNFRGVLNGNVDFAVFESAPAGTRFKSSEIDLSRVDPVDSVFRKEFEEADYEQLNMVNTTREQLQQIFLFSPISGIISQSFNIGDGHYGIDIVARKDEPVKTVADGTVIMSSWTQDSGYVVAVQHKNQLVSFYKHNSVLLKKVGDPVKAGDIVAIIGNSGELTDGPHLHFELWFDGNPVNPEDFIAF